MAGLPCPIPDEKNSFLIYKSLFDVFSHEESEFMEKAIQPGFDPLSGEVKWLLANHPHVLAKMLEASLRPGYYYPFSLDDEFYDYKDTQGQLDLFRFCGLAAMNLAAKGRLYEAGQILNDLRLFSNRLQKFPGKSLHYFGPHFQGLIRDYEEKCLFASEGKPENAMLPASTAAFYDFPQKPLELEFTWVAQAMVSQDFKLEDASCVRKLSGEMYFIDKVCCALPMETLFINYQFDQMEILLKNWKLLVERPCINFRENLSQSFAEYEHSYIGQMLGGLYKFGAMDFKCSAQLHNNMEILIRALWDYRIEHGQYPKSLDALVPDFLGVLPLNPLTGQPLAVEFIDGGLTIKSQAPKDSMVFFPNDFHMGAAFEKNRLAEKNQTGKDN
ncbi:hypothetical protein [Desulfatibacillum alkenivorans]|nr:hypothetical protein [Desulfatibacillum alkenivorans]